MKTPLRLIAFALASATLVSCATVDVTKTGKGYFPPTNPNNVDILMTVPSRSYTELATVTTAGYPMRQEAKLHNAIRVKAAPLGASAVIIQDQGIMANNGRRWATGVAIRYNN